MTINGTILKTVILLLCAVATASVTWNQFNETHDPGAASGLMMIGAIGGFMLALVTVFKKNWAMVTAPAYALLEGLFLGGASALFELRYPGIAMQAVALTFGTAFCMLMAYRSGLIRADAEVHHRSGRGHRRHRVVLRHHHGARLVPRQRADPLWQQPAEHRASAC